MRITKLSASLLLLLVLASFSISASQDPAPPTAETPATAPPAATDTPAASTAPPAAADTTPTTPSDTAPPADTPAPDVTPTDATPTDTAPPAATPAADATPGPVPTATDETAPPDTAAAPPAEGSSEATPTDSTPPDSTPADSTPTDSTPTDSTPTDSTPTDSTPTDNTPTDSTPTETPSVGPPTVGEALVPTPPETDIPATSPPTEAQPAPDTSTPSDTSTPAATPVDESPPPPPPPAEPPPEAPPAPDVVWTGAALDPCQPINHLAKGDGFVLGIMYWAGQSIPAWESAINSANFMNLTPCNFTSDTINEMAANGVQFAVYNIKVDRLSMLQVPFFQIVDMLRGGARYIRVVAYRANVRSWYQYTFSSNSSATSGTGFVTSLSLLAKFTKGKLQYLQWYDITCDSCSGRSNALCIHQPQNQYACSLPFENCFCNATSGTSCNYVASSGSTSLSFGACATAINIGFLGDDSHKAPLTSGMQIQQVNAYSIVGLYFTAKTFVTNQFNRATNILNNTYNNFVTQVNKQWNFLANETFAPGDTQQTLPMG